MGETRDRLAGNDTALLPRDATLELHLTLRERQLLRLISTGMTNREMADELGLAEKTVKNYVSGLFCKLGVARRAQAAVVGVRLERSAPRATSGADGMGPSALPGERATVHAVDMQTHSHPPDPDLANTIVVGHDGSHGGESAFELALRLAERLGATLLVVRAWTIDTAPHGTLVSGGYVASFDEASAKVARILERDVADLVTAHPGVTFRFKAKFGQPAAVLIAASPGALMLVVGSRGHGGFSSLLLGSVSEQCTRHAHCPVLVVRPRDPKAGGEP
ncbi:hypothetical protein GCM10027413_07710 [Conyzicola nivalis]|uniref:HTH luxR-type domain-containing protein n=1 Tax=Conyzicola nivalis TaxID=1477021 RepID=A0A916WIK3_9MICO|nr:universal stress protein [Conyzicola nivalis]GGB04448.1 hypothetical protein GCM10010979_18920 [Conyzicola nivalis]